MKVRSPTPDSEHTGAPGFTIDWTLPPLSAEAFLCPEPVRGRHGTQQKYALQRLVTTARDTDEGWSNALARIKPSTESFSTLLAAARKVDSVVESTSRMVAIQSFTKQRLSEPSNSLPDFTVRVIQALNYAKLWDHSDAEKGGKTWKTQALWLLFVSANATHGLSSSSVRKEQSDGVQEAYEKFKKQHDRLIQHRKLLLRLYNTFGAGVLIDRQWDYDNCVRSYPPAYLRDLVEQVEAELPTAKEVLRAWKEKYSAMETVMARILTKVGDPSVATYAQEFMEGMPPTWQLLTYH
ncbi:hypothetical protein CYLTODRAFT_419223 [Cylindrobasidium torrendii FP15055 ss-10]|uniref:Uncharacterized protein n=1 Tax=Cylindrobasidium torrendii FP15055 ss-10 TaxID=1314674 RepID=A0A0D7BLQ9_9AGAR|nr:hypothetical protein CYLTODRAFT_419223 [Cylindrobasidium torrendii FP15055 ss-10]